MPLSSGKRESPGSLNAGARPTRNYRGTGWLLCVGTARLLESGGPFQSENAVKRFLVSPRQHRVAADHERRDRRLPVEGLFVGAWQSSTVVATIDGLDSLR